MHTNGWSCYWLCLLCNTISFSVLSIILQGHCCSYNAISVFLISLRSISCFFQTNIWVQSPLKHFLVTLMGSKFLFLSFLSAVRRVFNRWTLMFFSNKPHNHEIFKDLFFFQNALSIASFSTKGVRHSLNHCQITPLSCLCVCVCVHLFF